MPEPIQAVLNVDYTNARYTTEGLKGYTHMPILDGPNPGREWLINALTVLGQYRASQWNTYVHCQAGISRSVFVTAALLVREQGVTPKEAVKMINAKSGFADPAPAFLLALEDFYKEEMIARVATP